MSGHETLRMFARKDGARLLGASSFVRGHQPAFLSYGVEVSEHWIARRVWVRGHVGLEAISLDYEHEANGWTRVGKGGHLALDDIDLGFSPATNLLPIKRLDFPIGETVETTAAWVDPQDWKLKPLRQTYRRLAEHRFAYTAPDIGYEGEISVFSNGLVKSYEGLWRAVAAE